MDKVFMNAFAAKPGKAEKVGYQRTASNYFDSASPRARDSHARGEQDLSKKYGLAAKQALAKQK